jgi:cell wall-associated NlpC family hydrolase
MNSNQGNNRTKEVAKDVAKQQAKKAAVNSAKKVGGLIAKKAGASIGALLLKLAPIIIPLILIVLVVVVLVSLFSPDITHTKGKTKEEDMIQRLVDYQQLGMLIPTDVEWLISLDMAIEENKDLLDININDNAWHFMGIHFEKYIPEHEVCETSENSDGEEITTCTTVPEQILEVIISEGKEEVQGFLDSYGVPTDNIKEALEELEKVVAELNSKDSMLQYRYWTYGMPLEFAMDDAKLDKHEKEYVEDILDVGYIPELYEEYGLTLWGGTSIGSGAYCSPTKEVDHSKIQTVLASAGVFRGYEDTFISVAESFGIDPVLFVSIALHETGNGTSNAVVNKNNPGGLMNPATGSKELFEYSSLTDGIKAMGQTLHNRIIKDGLTTIDRLGAVYAPVGAANDPNGLNQHWVGNVSKYTNSLGGLVMNCESYSDQSIVFTGDVSEIAQIIATSGLKWINNSQYVFGGGRNQGDIAKGYFDCSSFVHWAYAQAGVDLGNLSSVSTETLNKTGKKISISELQVGDLIFWDTYKKDGHVGIYIGDGKFIGSQTSTGVSIENVNSPFWSSVFNGHVRRILE